MKNATNNTKKQFERLKKKNPMYRTILDFYEKIVLEQEKINPQLNIAPAEIHTDKITIHLKEGFPLIRKEDFVLDMPSSVKLFQSVCKISMTANKKMNEHIQVIEKAFLKSTGETEELLSRYYDEPFLNTVAERLEIEKAILTFLIQMSIQPSIRAQREQLNGKVNPRDWLRGYCPVCGSLPQMSELKEEGKRCFLCSFCGYEWLGLRLQCPYCENSNHKQLHYFYAEGQEAYRVDVCDKCKKYIKTIDSRKLDYTPDLYLEDIVTMHLDIIASKKGFQRPLRNIWGL